LACRDSGVGERSGCRSLDACQDLVRVVLDPARLREMLRELRVPAPDHLEPGRDDETRRPGRPLVDGEDHAASVARAFPVTSPSRVRGPKPVPPLSLSGGQSPVCDAASGDWAALDRDTAGEAVAAQPFWPCLAAAQSGLLRPLRKSLTQCTSVREDG